MARRLLAGELMLSFVPEPEQRGWRLMTRGRLQLVRERVSLQSQLEPLLEEARIKLSSVINDLLGASGRRILEALSKGETGSALRLMQNPAVTNRLTLSSPQFVDHTPSLRIGVDT